MGYKKADFSCVCKAYKNEEKLPGAGYPQKNRPKTQNHRNVSQAHFLRFGLACRIGEV